MTVRSRLILSTLAITLVLVLPSIYAASRLAQVRDIALAQREKHAAAFLAVGRLQAHLAEADRYQRSFIAAPSAESKASTRQALASAKAQLDVLDRSGYEFATKNPRAQLAALIQASQQLEQMIESQQAQQATSYFEQVKPMYARFDDALDGIAAAVDRRSSSAAAEAIRISDAAATTAIIATLVGLVIALAIGVWTSGALTYPLRRLRRSTATVAAGEFVLAEDLPYHRSDEIGDLSRSFRSMTQRLAELDKLKAEFIGVATHELKTPLNVISGYAELVEEGVYGPITDKHREVLESIRAQTQVLARMVNQLLDISRLEAGGFKIEIEPVDVSQMFAQIERTFEPLAHKKQIRFDVTLQPDVPVQILADGDRLRDQVLGNLLSNAFKFTKSGGSIMLSARRRNGSVEIEVKDTGVGIPQDELPHIFEKWHQVGTEARSKGTGLGLNIAHEIVHAHGGNLTVESVSGEGTTFCIILPVDATPPATNGSASPERTRNPETV